MLDGDFHLGSKILSLKSIKDTYRIDKNSNTARTLTKITDWHIKPNDFEKMSCFLALLVLSHTMAATLRTCAENGQIEAENGKKYG